MRPVESKRFSAVPPPHPTPHPTPLPLPRRSAPSRLVTSLFFGQRLHFGAKKFCLYNENTSVTSVKSLINPLTPLPLPPQVSSIEAGPYICVWDSRVGSQQGNPELARIEFDKEARGIIALGFSADGTKLAAVGSDNYHTVYVYDWRRQKCKSSGRGAMGKPPQVRDGGPGACDWGRLSIHSTVTCTYKDQLNNC